MEEERLTFEIQNNKIAREPVFRGERRLEVSTVL